MPHATCHACGARRPLTDMQRTYQGGRELWWCHPIWQTDTCYDRNSNTKPSPRLHHVDNNDDEQLAPPEFDD